MSKVRWPGADTAGLSRESAASRGRPEGSFPGKVRMIMGREKVWKIV